MLLKKYMKKLENIKKSLQVTTVSALINNIIYVKQNNEAILLFIHRIPKENNDSASRDPPETRQEFHYFSYAGIP
jgi:uncharacterized membrane protein